MHIYDKQGKTLLKKRERKNMKISNEVWSHKK